MSEKVQLKGVICEVNFGYDARMEGYTNSSSDITKLCEMLGRLNINITKFLNNPKNFNFTNAIKRRL